MSKHFQYSIFNIQYSTRRGFTIVELLVSIGIFLVLTGVVLARYRTFDTNAKFANASEDIVLALRQAQVYGVGVKGESTSFNVPYGVYFDTATPSQIKVFADKDTSGTHNAGDTDLETISWLGGIGIKTISGLLCDTTSVSSIAITFNRPFPDARIIDNNTVTPCATGGTITITNGTKNASVVINTAGQISIQ